MVLNFNCFRSIVLSDCLHLFLPLSPFSYDLIAGAVASLRKTLEDMEDFEGDTQAILAAKACEGIASDLMASPSNSSSSSTINIDNVIVCRRIAEVLTDRYCHRISLAAEDLDRGEQPPLPLPREIVHWQYFCFPCI